jgi:hypothetical protein
MNVILIAVGAIASVRAAPSVAPSATPTLSPTLAPAISPVPTMPVANAHPCQSISDACDSDAKCYACFEGYGSGELYPENLQSCEALFRAWDSYMPADCDTSASPMVDLLNCVANDIFAIILHGIAETDSCTYGVVVTASQADYFEDDLLHQSGDAAPRGSPVTLLGRAVIA